MVIRNMKPYDLPEVMQIFEDAREYMCANGNPHQWTNGYPQIELIEKNMANNYVCIGSHEEIAATFYFCIEEEPTYAKIDGQWLNEEPYGVVHRIARSRNAKGTAATCLEWCLSQCQNIRIDTHSDNLAMRRLLEKNGYSYCGIIWLSNGEERMAFQKVQ